MIFATCAIVAGSVGLAIWAVSTLIAKATDRTQARTPEPGDADEDDAADEDEDEDEDDVALFVHGDIVDVSVTYHTDVRGRVVGVVGQDNEVRLVIQVGNTTFLARPDYCEKAEEKTVGYRDSARRDLN